MIDYTEETVTREIDGFMYTSDKLPCMTAVKLLARAQLALGERGMRAVVQRHAAVLAEEAPLLVLGAKDVHVYGALLQASHGVEQDPTLIRDMLQGVRVDRYRPAGPGGPVARVLDEHFKGEFPHLLRVLDFVAAHNYLGFTLGRRSLSGRPSATPTAPSSPSPAAE